MYFICWKVYWFRQERWLQVFHRFAPSWYRYDRQMSRSWGLTCVFLASISLETMDCLYLVRSSVIKILSLLFFNSFLALKTLFFAFHVLNLQIIWSLLFLFGRPIGWDRSISSDVIVTPIFSQMLITTDSVSVFPSSVPGLGTLWNLKDVRRPYCSKLSRSYSRSSTLCCNSDLLFFSISISSFCSSMSFCCSLTELISG